MADAKEIARRVMVESLRVKDVETYPADLHTFAANAILRALVAAAEAGIEAGRLEAEQAKAPS